MHEPDVSKLYLDNEELLLAHCSLYGVEPAPRSTVGSSVRLTKTLYTVGRIRLSSANTLSGWGFSGPLRTDSYYISNTSSGNSVWEVSGHGRVSAPSQVCIVDSCTLVAGEFSCGTTMETIIVEADFLHQQLASLQGFPCLQRIQFQPFIDGVYGTNTWTIISSLVQSIKVCVDQGLILRSPLALSYLKQALILMILERLPHNYQLSRDRKETCVLPSHVNRAVDYINAHARQDIMLSDIAVYACTSVRNLQMGFKRFKKTTPLRYLRSVRLQLAHASLKDPAESATWQQVALGLGFADLGSFSRYYKSVYGQSPAEHQRKVRGT